MNSKVLGKNRCRQNGRGRFRKGIAERWNLFVKNFPLTVLALPGIIILFVFNYIPLYGLILPFKNYRADLGFFKSPWVGFNNFKFLFAGESIKNATFNTVAYNFVFIFLGTALSVILALMLFELKKRSVKVYQTIIFLPYFVSWVVAAFVFRALLDMEYGVFNKILEVFGKDPIMWYNEPKYWPAILISANLWKGLGYSSVIFYASLMGLNKEYFEAALIDGASKLVQIRYISIPLIKPIITITVLLNIGRIFYGDFGLFYNVTLNSSLLYKTTDVIDTFVYRALIDLGDIGMASAAGFYQSLVGFLLVLLANFAVKKIDGDNALF